MKLHKLISAIAMIALVSTMVILAPSQTDTARADFPEQVTQSQLAAWGVNAAGNLGLGTNSNVATPTQAGVNTDWVQVSAGLASSCGVQVDGSLWCWGANSDGQVGNGTTNWQNAPVQIDASGWTQVTVGHAFACGIHLGAAKCWGKNPHGQLGNATTTASTVPVAVNSSASWSQLAAHNWTVCGIQTNGTLWCWGLGLGTGAGLTSPTQVGTHSDWEKVSVGNGSACGIRSAGSQQLWCWGANDEGQLGIGSTADTTSPALVDITPNASFSDVSVGLFHACAVQTGATFCWGENIDGQLGDGTTSSSTVPVAVTVGTFTNLDRVSAGYYHTCGMDVGASTMHCWGNNDEGQLGDGTTTSSSTPVAVPGTWDAFDGGAAFTLALGPAPAPTCTNVSHIVATDAELQNAIACYNAQNPAGDYDITLAADIATTSDYTINPVDPTRFLLVDGAGYSVSQTGTFTSSRNVFVVSAGEARFEHIEIVDPVRTGIFGTAGVLVTVSDSIVDGGWFGIGSAGDLVVERSTVTGATSYGVIHESSGLGLISNSTIAGNETGVMGSGPANTIVANSTVVNNGKGLVNVTAVSTIVTASYYQNSDCSAVTDGGDNYSSGPAADCNFFIVTDATLDALAANSCAVPLQSGCAKTISLLSGNEAIDGGSCWSVPVSIDTSGPSFVYADLLIDQRGDPRPGNLDYCDAGAVESVLSLVDPQVVLTTAASAAACPSTFAAAQALDVAPVESMTALAGSAVTFCLNAANLGGTDLSSVSVRLDRSVGSPLYWPPVAGGVTPGVFPAGAEFADSYDLVMSTLPYTVTLNIDEGNVSLDADEIVVNAAGPTCNGLAVTHDMNVLGTTVHFGTPGPDVILGTPGNDVIDGVGGNDTICAGDGNDVVTGGDGDDTIFGEGGFDTINGGVGNDTIDGGANGDVVNGESGDDTITGGKGWDKLSGASGEDTISGGQGNDQIFGGGGIDTLDGGIGGDLILGYDGDDVISGGDGKDLINGQNGNDTIDGGAQHDQIWGRLGNDTIDGGPGYDWIWGYWGNDIIDGGPGADSIFAEGGNDTVTGGPGADLIDGSFGIDDLSGGDGNDTLRGGFLDDILDGGAGTDTCDGGGGNDTATTCETLIAVP